MAMKFVLTNKGLELKAKIEAGAVLNFTKAETGDIYSPIPLELQSVPNARQILDIDSIIVNDDTATIKIILSNLENTEEYNIKQLGLYASDPDTGDEILYIIGQDSIGERVPAITDMQVEYEFDVNIKAGNAASIRFEVNGEAFLRKKQFQAFLEDEFYPHINDKEIHHKHENKKLLDTITNIFSEASTLTALKSGDTLPVLLSKTAKAISTLISHIVLTGTASILGHVKLSDTYATKLANGAAANGLGASQNALYNAYSTLNTNLSGKAPAVHYHDDRYYTEGEINVFLSKKSDTWHNHDSIGSGNDWVAAVERAFRPTIATGSGVLDLGTPDYKWRHAYFQGSINSGQNCNIAGRFISAGTYNNTTSGSSNLNIASNGYIARSTSSSKRYKTNIKNVENEDINPFKLLEVPIRQFKYKKGYITNDPDNEIDYIGFIVEELEKYYPQAVEYQAGKPEMWNYKVLIPAMLWLIQDLYNK